MADTRTEVPSAGSPVQTKGIESPTSPAEIATSGVPSSGRRPAFRDVRRQLTDTELSGTGVQKLLLDMLEEADIDREHLESYVSLYHEADKKAAVLAERVRTHAAIEIFFGVGVGLGGTIIGLVPFFWGCKPEYGMITGLVGLALLVGAVVGRIVKK